jgi:hypothetical protein
MKSRLLLLLAALFAAAAIGNTDAATRADLMLDLARKAAQNFKPGEPIPQVLRDASPRRPGRSVAPLDAARTAQRAVPA